MVRLARKGVDRAAPVMGDLNGEVGRRAEPEETEAAAGLNPGELERPVADDPRAEQRRRLLRREAPRQPIHPGAPSRHALRVPPVAVASRERRLFAEVLAAARAKAAAPARRSEPADAHRVAGVEVAGARPDLDDPSCRLVPRHDRQPGRHLALDDVEVCPAHPTGFDRDRDLAVAGRELGSIFDRKRLALERLRLPQNHRPHRGIFPRFEARTL